MLPKDWLKQFLSSKTTTLPDGSPLYRYRLSDDDFETLKATLKTSALLGVANITEVTGWNAAFVLYAAEWWRREYDGGQWLWSNVFASFGANSEELKISRRNLLVESGLRFWRREVRILNGSSRYLGSIAIEGGLPLNQLNKSSGWLGRVFKQVIPKYARLQQAGVHADMLISECDFIPANYQNSQTNAILGDMVQTVVELKQTYQLHERDNPVSYLDRHAPSWREQFPLPIETEVGQKLLSDMISTAAKTADVGKSQPFCAIRSLRADGSVQLQFEFARFVSLDQLGLPETIPTRLEVELIDSTQIVHRLGVALTTTYKQQASLQIPKPPGIIKGINAAYGYALRFKHLSTLIYETPIIGGEELDNGLPWTFAQQQDDWVLEGTASVSTRAKYVRVLYPNQMVYKSESEIQELTPFAEQKQLQLSGHIQLSDNENNTFIIKTAQANATNSFYLKGQRLGFASTPHETYQGLPSLVRINHEAETSSEIPPTKLVAKTTNGLGQWHPLTEKLIGVYVIALLDNQGSILFRKKCALLPKAFAVRFKPSTDSLDGSIYLDNTGNATVLCDVTVKHDVTPDADGYRIRLYADNAPPSHVHLTLCWSGMAEMLTLTLPFPARGGHIINANGDKHPSNQPLFQDQLYGIRLRLFNEHPERKRHLQIELCLKDDSLEDCRELHLRDEVPRKGAVIELAIIDYLEWIKTLLAISKYLDSFVQLSVYEQGTELLRTHICRYQFKLERKLPLGCVALTEPDYACLSYEHLAHIELMAMRLSQPEQEHLKLKPHYSGQTETGCWWFHPETKATDSWLIYPTAASTVCLRPILWNVSDEAEAEPSDNQSVKTLHSAIKIAEKQSRQSAIRAILGCMSTDFEHSGWAYLRHLWERCDHLPLASFDVWSIAVTDSRLLAALVLQMDESFTKKLGEELPVFWELIPLHDWAAVFNLYRDYLTRVMGDEVDTSLTILKDRIERISQLCVSMDVVARILKQSLCGIADQELALMKQLNLDWVISEIKTAQQELDRRQADSRWPEVFRLELLSHWRQVDKSQQLGLKLEAISDHHYPVVILPVLLANYCACANTPEKWVGDATVIFKLKTLKAFDENWFNDVFKIALAYLSQQAKD